MKKKALAGHIIAPEIMNMAKQSIAEQRTKTAKPCVVCGSVSTPQVIPGGKVENDDLCWVCRRLKISAWREAEQVSVQE